DGLRRLGGWRLRGRPAGRGLALAVVAVCLLTFGIAGAKHVAYAGRAAGEEPPWFLRRVEIQRQLEQSGGRHLVLVTARSDHFGSQQWVANGADIDGSPVVWARDLGPGNNGPLLDHFAGRELWLLDAGPRGTTLTRGAGPR
ncbi:MAG TPA: hypothetical protein VK997_08260, partial [Deferrisomatales bacterium]|nr:hypothetical protein [Deferrisomatales bacterium]